MFAKKWRNHKFTEMADQDEESRVGGVCHLLWDGHEGERGGKCGVTAVSSLSVIEAKGDCRYEEGRNYSDDMMGGTRGLHRHTTTIFIQQCKPYKPSKDLCVCVCLCV